MGTFQDQTQLGQNLKMQTYDFKTKASEVIRSDAFGTREVLALLDNTLSWIDEFQHQKKVREVIIGRNLRRIQR